MLLVQSTFTRSSSSDTIRGMGKAGKALRQTLETYGISQNKLAVTLRVDRSVVFHWFHENRDPSAQTVVEIAEALKSINPEAAAEFIRLYVGDYLKPDMLPKSEE
jgi:predicted transcriptional regulator